MNYKIRPLIVLSNVKNMEVIEDSVLAFLHLLNENTSGNITCYVAEYDSIADSMKHIDDGMELAHSNALDKNKILTEIQKFSQLDIKFLGR